MNDFVLMTDSCCDLPASLAEELGLVVVPLNVTLDGQHYKNYLDGREISFPRFYEKMREVCPVSTAAPSIGDFISYAQPCLEAGKDILYLAFSSALSGTWQAGKLAFEELAEQYPQRKLLIVDTHCASLGQGMLVYRTALRQKAGCTIEEAAAFAEEARHTQCHWFTANDLNYFYRGGRVSKATAIIGTALQMKPMMHCDDNGCLTKYGAVRGRKMSLTALKEKLKETICDAEGQTIFICHGDCPEEANALADMIRAEVPVKDVIVHYIGPVIGAHTGPDVIGLFHAGTIR